MEGPSHCCCEQRHKRSGDRENEGKDLVIGHSDSYRLGLNGKGWVGTDPWAITLGPLRLPATKKGKWVY